LKNKNNQINTNHLFIVNKMYENQNNLQQLKSENEQLLVCNYIDNA